MYEVATPANAKGQAEISRPHLDAGFCVFFGHLRWHDGGLKLYRAESIAFPPFSAQSIDPQRGYDHCPAKRQFWQVGVMIPDQKVNQ